MRELNDFAQGSPEWLMARASLPTCSRFGEILTPLQLKPSESARRYRALLLAEWYTGMPLDEEFASSYMKRGIELEPSAVAWYEFAHDVETRKVGLCLSDDGRVAGSPDRLVGEDGGLEIKCPGIAAHAFYMAEGGSPLIREHRSQVQGLLWLTGRAWWDLCSWSPVLPSVVVRVFPDKAYQEAIGPAMEEFLEGYESLKRKYAPLKADRDRAMARAEENADHCF